MVALLHLNVGTLTNTKEVIQYPWATGLRCFPFPVAYFPKSFSNFLQVLHFAAVLIIPSSTEKIVRELPIASCPRGYNTLWRCCQRVLDNVKGGLPHLNAVMQNCLQYLPIILSSLKIRRSNWYFYRLSEGLITVPYQTVPLNLLWYSLSIDM
jgi:hypothetical protein